jgi:serine phosphatase RsbU (regulator of sigma subunit)
MDHARVPGESGIVQRSVGVPPATLTSPPVPGPAPSRREERPPAPPPGPSVPRPSPKNPLDRPGGVSYRASLIVSLSLLVVLTGLAVSLLAFRGARAGNTALAHDLFREVSDHAVTRTRGFLASATPAARALGSLADLGMVSDDRDRLARQLTAVLRALPGVSWVSYGDESGAFVGALRTRAGEVHVNQSRIKPDGRTDVVEYDVQADGSWRQVRHESDSGYDPRSRPYYRLAGEARRLVWTPPYVFYDQGVPGVTCANPLFDPAGNLRGVFTVDFDLGTLSQFVGGLSVSPNSRLFILTPDGTVLAHPAQRQAAEAAAAAVARSAGGGLRGRGELLKIKDLGDPLVTAFDAQLRPEDRTPAPAGRDRARQFEFRQGGTDYFARATTFTVNGDLVWIVGAVAPQSDFLAGARRTSALAAAASVGAMLVAVALAMALARRVSGPVLAMVSFMNGVGSGRLTGRAPRLGGAREFGQLAEALDRMLGDLRDRTRLREAMSAAVEIQQGLLPARGPAIDGLDVHGFSAYCDETGGDYFDYLVFDKGRSPDGGDGGGAGLLVAIGDVVGHGIGAALLMAGARGILHSRAAGCSHLGELLTHLNEQLVPDTAGCRFVTMMLWYVEPRTGRVCWANAGHDPAIVYDPATDQFTESGPRGGGIPLGIQSGVNYREYAFGPLRAGQVVVLGTDGIWEAINPAGEFFGKARLRESVRAAAADGGTAAADIAAAVRRDLERFRGAQHQRDDVTLVVIKVRRTGTEP